MRRVRFLETIVLIVRRDYRERIRSRAFVIATLVLVVGTIGGVVGTLVVQHFSGGTTQHTIGTVSAPAELSQTLAAAGTAYDMQLTAHEYPNAAAADAALNAKQVDAVLIGSSEIRFRTSKDTNLVNATGQAVRAAVAIEGLRAAGISDTQIQQIFGGTPLKVTYLDKSAGPSSSNQGAAVIMAVVLFGALMSYNQWILMSVVEEKASRIVEVLLAVVRPWQLLVGKLGGVLALAITQMVVVAIVFLVSITAAGKASIPDVSAGEILVAVGWFVLGLAFYSVAFAAIGATVSRQEDASTAAAPLTMVLVAAYVVSIVFVTSNGNSAMAQVLTLIPLTAPLVAPVRFSLGSLPIWQDVLAAAIMLAAIGAGGWLGGRLYARAILHTGPRMSWMETLRTVRRREPSAGGPASG